MASQKLTLLPCVPLRNSERGTPYADAVAAGLHDLNHKKLARRFGSPARLSLPSLAVAGPQPAAALPPSAPAVLPAVDPLPPLPSLPSAGMPTSPPTPAVPPSLDRRQPPTPPPQMPLSMSVTSGSIA